MLDSIYWFGFSGHCVWVRACGWFWYSGFVRFAWSILGLWDVLIVCVECVFMMLVGLLWILGMVLVGCFA